MANEIRLRQGFLGGLVEDNPLLIGATSLTSASLAAMQVVTSTSHLPIVLDPDGYEGDPEIAWVTAHTVGATSCTLLRGQEGTAPRQHNKSTPWRHGPLMSDFALTGSMLPAWIAPSLTNSWVNFGTPYALAGYYLEPSGTVRLRGMLKGGAVSTIALTLPVGYRPEYTMEFMGLGFDGASTFSPVYVEVTAAGTVEIGYSTVAAGRYFSFGSLTFRQFG